MDFDLALLLHGLAFRLCAALIGVGVMSLTLHAWIYWLEAKGREWR